MHKLKILSNQILTIIYKRIFCFILINENLIAYIYELALTRKDRHDRQQTNRHMTEKMPTLRKIKRAASHHTSQRFCSTFNFAQPHLSPPTALTYTEKINHK